MYLKVKRIYPNGLTYNINYVRRMEEDHQFYYVWLLDDLKPQIYSKKSFQMVKE